MFLFMAVTFRCVVNLYRYGWTIIYTHMQILCIAFDKFFHPIALLLDPGLRRIGLCIYNMYE